MCCQGSGAGRCPARPRQPIVGLKRAKTCASSSSPAATHTTNQRSKHAPSEASISCISASPYQQPCGGQRMVCRCQQERFLVVVVLVPEAFWAITAVSDQRLTVMGLLVYCRCLSWVEMETGVWDDRAYSDHSLRQARPSIRDARKKKEILRLDLPVVCPTYESRSRGAFSLL